MTKLHTARLFIFLLLLVSAYGQRGFEVRPTESGGVLITEQAAYDVKRYDLDLIVFPDEKSIRGVLSVQARILKPLDKFVLHLDSALTVDSVLFLSGSNSLPLTFLHQNGKIMIKLPSRQRGGKIVQLSIAYGGKPKVAPHPPWVGGFIWSQTKSGAHWIATAVQMDGADLWFPVKDHPSDKPETTNLRFTVPDNLVVASNGRLQSVKDNGDGTKTFHWFVSQPISNYNIAFNAAPYKVIKDQMTSVSGDSIPIEFYVLPEDEEKGQSLIDKTKDYVRFFEKYLGPYPFRADKLGIAQTPHLGMEHQSIIAYGNNFRYDANGFDWLMFHELGHEWWANLVTVPDWNDFWIHEGFQSFFDMFYAETIFGREQFIKILPNRVKSTRNLKPLAPRKPKTTTEMYLIPPDYVRSDGDIYNKGALVLNTLRGLIGDDAFFRSLRKMCYENAAEERITNGKQVKFRTTDDFLRIVEKELGKNLKWFFEVYVRQPELPELIIERKDNLLILRWKTPRNLFFPLPVEVKVGDTINKIPMTNGQGSLRLKPTDEYEIDPNGWILRKM